MISGTYFQSKTRLLNNATARVVVILFLASASLYPLKAFSRPTRDANITIPVEVSDAELANFRGRYISMGKVLYFGISMFSKWVRDTGQTIRVGLKLGFPFSGAQQGKGSGNTNNKTTSENTTFRAIRHPNPFENDDNPLDSAISSFDISNSHAASTHLDDFASLNSSDTTSSISQKKASEYSSAKARVSVEDPVDTTGVIQRIHIAGDLNKISNDIGFDIQVKNPEQPSIQPAPSEDSPPDTQITSRNVSIDRQLSFSRSESYSRQIDIDTARDDSSHMDRPHTEPIAQSNQRQQVYVSTLVPEAIADGVEAKSYIEKDKLGVSIKIPGVGELKQQLASGGVESVKGVLQQVVLAGNRQQIKNSLRLQAILQGDTATRAPDIRNSLRSLIHLQTRR